MNARLTGRTVFLSDIHLGYKDCKADFLLKFLDAPLVNDNEGIYVNCGDWIESCTCVIEGEDGSIHLIDVPAWLRQLETKFVAKAA